jgi:hypothetical protein
MRQRARYQKRHMSAEETLLRHTINRELIDKRYVIEHKKAISKIVSNVLST